MAVAHAGWGWLQPQEVERARQIRSGVARDEFVAGRAVLRYLLARELGCAAQEVQLRQGAEGKPELDGIDFNVTHSRGVVLIALSLAGAVGVDLEQMDRTVEALEIARASFHEDEIRWIEETPEAQRAGVFLRCWTRKEALVKADGRGLSLPLRSFSVCGDGDEEELVRLHSHRVDYYVRDLPARAGEVAAMALGRPGVPITALEWAAYNHLDTQSGPWSIPFSAGIVHPVTT